MNVKDLHRVTRAYPFLQHIKAISDEEEARLRSMCSSWNTIGNHLQKMSLEELEKAIVTEISGKSRLSILSRLNTRRIKLRSQVESKMLTEKVLGAKHADSPQL